MKQSTNYILHFNKGLHKPTQTKYTNYRLRNMACQIADILVADITYIQNTHLDQKASQADVYEIQILQIEKHDFQDCRHNYKSSRHDKNPK